MTPFEAAFFVGAIVFYSLAFAGGVYLQFFDRKLPLNYRVLFFSGAISHALAFVSRWVSAGHVPTIGSYENLLTGTLFISLIIMAVLWGKRREAAFVYSLPFLFLLMGVALVSDTSAKPFLASLRSFWLYIHILFAWLSYGAFTTAAGVAVTYLLKGKKGELRDELDELMFKLTAFGLITDAVMIAAGSIWAKNLWGSYWSWDPVETWSLISFLLYGLVLHLRVTLKWKGRRIAWLLIVSLVTVLISFWGVNFLMKSTLHVFTVDG